MKSEELLNSLDHIGEDLLAEAEQNILVRTRRPWLKTAVAAVLVAAIGVGGWLTLNHFTMKSSVPATEPRATSVTDPVRPVETLPKLELADSWEKLQGRMTVVSGDLDLCPDGITSLPVYRDLSGEENGSGICYSDEQMQTLLDEAIRRIGASPLGEVVKERYGNRLLYLTRNTDKGNLSVWNNGDIYLDLDGRFDIASERAESSEDLVLTDGSPFSNDILSCVRRDQELLGLPEDLIVVYQEYSSVLIFPARSNPAEQLVVRSFDAVQQGIGSEHSLMDNIYWNQRLGAAGWYDAEPDFLELQGWYPTITLAEAKQMALEGKGFCIETKDLDLTEDRITGMELVYSDVGSEMRIPYYRFWFSRSFEALYGGNDDFYVCIPAIQPEFLSDWQSDSEVRTPVNTPVFTTRMDMYYYVSGYAGEVEALQFPGYEPEFAVTADVDGDGNEELVYLYTDGTHFVGIAAYGLDEGRPVIKGSTVFALNGRGARLDYDPDSGVWFSLSGNTEEYRSSTAIRARLSVEDGSIVLSEALPDECLIRADASFVKIACGDSYYAYEGKCYFTDGTTMVWDLYSHGLIQKRNILSGEEETLFELLFDEDSYTALIGVTDERLYFCEYTQNGSTTYSVNYRNEDRTEIGNALEYSFANGLLVLENFRTDVRPVTVQVIDGRDRKVADYKVCWCSAFVDGSLYFVYMPELQEYGKLEGIPAELRDRDVTLSYAVCRVDPDGSVTELGAIQRNYPNGWNMESAWIDPETHTISFDYTGLCYDLFTLALKTDELPEDLHELVEDSISVQGAYTDACDNLCDYSYTLPRLKLDNEEAQAINGEIDEIYGAYVRRIQSRKDGDISLEYPEISYETAVWGDVVTIVISEYNSYDYVSYDVYCYDCTAKRRLDTPALLEKLGVSQERFLEACRATFRERYEKNTAAMPEEERAQYEKEVPEMLPESEKFVNLELQAYPGEDGTLMTVAPITSWVGATFYYHLIPVLDIQN